MYIGDSVNMVTFEIIGIMYEMVNEKIDVDKYLDNNKFVNLQLLGVPTKKIVSTPNFEVDGINYIVSKVPHQFSVSYNLFENNYLHIYNCLLRHLFYVYKYVYTVQEVGRFKLDNADNIMFYIDGVTTNWDIHNFAIVHDNQYIFENVTTFCKVLDTKIFVNFSIIDWDKDGCGVRIIARLNEIISSKLPVNIDIDNQVYKNCKLISMDCENSGLNRVGFDYNLEFERN